MCMKALPFSVRYQTKEPKNPDHEHAALDNAIE